MSSPWPAQPHPEKLLPFATENAPESWLEAVFGTIFILGMIAVMIVMLEMREQGETHD